MKRFIRVICVLIAAVLIHGIAFAVKIPDSIGGIKLGQKSASIKEMNNVKFAGYKGSLYTYLSENGSVDTLRFSAADCGEDDEKPCAQAMKKLRANYLKEFKKPKLDEEKNVVWEQDGKRLTLGWDYTGGMGYTVFIYIEKADDTKPGGISDGFKEFYSKFTTAYNNNDRGQLVSMMKFPFEGNCSISIMRENTFDGNLKKAVGSVNPELKDSPVFIRNWTPRMYFSSYVGNGIGFNKIKGKWYAVGVYCSE